MSFKAEESSVSCKPVETYPCLLRNTNSGSVVLFVAPGVGVRVASPLTDDQNGVGRAHSLWNFPDLPEHWEPWHGTVTISTAEG